MHLSVGDPYFYCRVGAHSTICGIFFATVQYKGSFLPYMYKNRKGSFFARHKKWEDMSILAHKRERRSNEDFVMHTIHCGKRRKGREKSIGMRNKTDVFFYGTYDMLYILYVWICEGKGMSRKILSAQKCAKFDAVTLLIFTSHFQYLKKNQNQIFTLDFSLKNTVKSVRQKSNNLEFSHSISSFTTNPCHV